MESRETREGHDDTEVEPVRRLVKVVCRAKPESRPRPARRLITYECDEVYSDGTRISKGDVSTHAGQDHGEGYVRSLYDGPNPLPKFEFIR